MLVLYIKILVHGVGVMTDQIYNEMIHSIIVPANLSIEEQVKRYQPLTEFLQTETPKQLYRFRQCNEWSIFAFDQDQLGVTPGYKMNDDFDALYSLWNYFENLIPCPDMFMITKILLHKASAWKHEKEWRLICTCNSPDFMQQEFPYATKRPTAIYLGRKISPIYEKILRHIAVEKNIPVYKMTLNNHESSYKLYPEIS